jgi:uncharacterized protein
MRPPSPFATWALLLVAMLYPTAAALLYFHVLAEDPRMAPAYTAAKVAQAALPLIGWLLLRMPRDPAWRRPSAGLGAGLASGVALGLATALLYMLWLRDSPLLEAAPAQVESRLDAFGAVTLPGYLALALFMSLLHSLFEEYYWRWFLFGALRRLLHWKGAVGLSSLAFAAHHGVVVAGLLGPGAPAAAIATGILAVALAGAVWAWLFHRFGSLLSPWSSHVVLDLVVMAIGLDLRA